MNTSLKDFGFISMTRGNKLLLFDMNAVLLLFGRMQQSFWISYY